MTEITIYKDGPAAVTNLAGETILIKHANGTTEEKQGLFLCRCGKSNVQPFCDGSHRPKDIL